MNRSSRRRTFPLLVATLALTAGCGGNADKISAARADVAGAAAAATSAEAAIAALAAKLSALTAATPAAVSSAASSPVPSQTPSPAASTGGLPAVPTGAALSSLVALPTTATAAAPASNSLSGALASANAALGGALSALDVSKQCATIPAAAVQALVKKPIGNPRPLPEICAWTGTNLQVTLSLNDPDESSYKDLTGSGDHPISGLGDVAEWSEPVPGMTLPDVNAHKGKVTCYVQSTDVPLSTIAYTGKDPFFKITEAASLDYATKEATLCADLFKVLT